MSDELTNLDNPVNRRDDLEERNQPHVTSIPAEAEADDIFDDSVETTATKRRGTEKSCQRPGESPQTR